LALANRNGGVGEEGPGVRKGQQGPPILILLWLEVGRRVLTKEVTYVKVSIECLRSYTPLSLFWAEFSGNNLLSAGLFISFPN